MTTAVKGNKQRGVIFYGKEAEMRARCPELVRGKTPENVLRVEVSLKKSSAVRRAIAGACGKSKQAPIIAVNIVANFDTVCRYHSIQMERIFRRDLPGKTDKNFPRPSRMITVDPLKPLSLHEAQVQDVVEKFGRDAFNRFSQILKIEADLRFHGQKRKPKSPETRDAILKRMLKDLKGYSSSAASKDRGKLALLVTRMNTVRSGTITVRQKSVEGRSSQFCAFPSNFGIVPTQDVLGSKHAPEPGLVTGAIGRWKAKTSDAAPQLKRNGNGMKPALNRCPEFSGVSPRSIITRMYTE